MEPASAFALHLPDLAKCVGEKKWQTTTGTDGEKMASDDSTDVSRRKSFFESLTTSAKHECDGPLKKEAALRDMKNKEMEIQGLLSALLLGVAGGGWFATADLSDEQPFFKSLSIIAFCVSVFSFMSTAIMSGGIMTLFFVAADTPIEKLQRSLGWLWVMPKVYFVMGYLSMILGCLGFLLCMISGHEVLLCLVFCGSIVILPTFLLLWRVTVEVSKPSASTNGQRGSDLV